MRILIFLDTDHLSGPARLALDFCTAARALGHEVLMLGLVRGPQKENADGAGADENLFAKAMREAGIPQRVLRERFRFDTSILRQFAAILEDFKPDLYQSHGYKGSMLGRRAQKFGVPWQAIFHGFTWENRLVRLYHALDVRWLRGADEVVVVSRGFGETLAGRGVPRARLRWVSNAIDETTLRATASGEPLRRLWREGLAPESPDSGNVILAGVIGRFSPEKAPDHFLRAFALAAAREPRLYAVMVGDGPALEACRALTVELGLTKRVRFAGFRTDLATIYAALDLMVIPSRSEGMPTVLLEAMLLGVPVVSTRVGAVPDVVVDGETALLAPIGDEAALGAAMARLAGDAALRGKIIAAAGKLARERLTVAGRTRTLLDHARCLLERRPLPEDNLTVRGSGK